MSASSWVLLARGVILPILTNHIDKMRGDNADWYFTKIELGLQFGEIPTNFPEVYCSTPGMVHVNSPEALVGIHRCKVL